MERNRSSGLVSSSFVELDSFFPFDPLKLPRCQSFVIDYYQQWIPEKDAEDEDTTEDRTGLASDDDEDEDSSMTMNMSMTPENNILLHFQSINSRSSKTQ